MQTPKIRSSSITQNNFINHSELPISPYKNKIKSLQQIISSSCSTIHFHSNFYKWLSKILLFSSLISSTILTSSIYFNKSNHFSSFNFLLCLTNSSSILLYNFILPSSKYILYKETNEGLNFLHQNIDTYLEKSNENDYTNYISFKTAYYKLMKKLDF
jgi:hypothetical protein